ncbi:Treslin [Camelus dromedarius]|uniref:Treslin n=1 Tax=Camelus dromedarius TaxID=9838 RepID=A0A5N4CES9_CAMDR|nr:Treslin [Camelus dromedarius]
MACCHNVMLLLDTAGGAAGQSPVRRAALRLLTYLSCRFGLARVRWAFRFFDSQGARSRPSRVSDFRELGVRSWEDFEEELETRLREGARGAHLPGPAPRATHTHSALMETLLDYQWDRPEITSPTKPILRSSGRRLLDVESEAREAESALGSFVNAVFLLAPCPHSQRELLQFVSGCEVQAQGLPPTPKQVMEKLLPKRVQEVMIARKITLYWVDTTEWSKAASSNKEESSKTESELTRCLSEFYQRKSREESTVSNQEDSKKKRGVPRTPVRQKMNTMCRSLKMLNVARLNVKAQKLHPDGSPDTAGEKGIQKMASGRTDKLENRGRTQRSSKPKDFKTEEELLSYVHENYQKTLATGEIVLYSCAQNMISNIKAFLKSKGTKELEVTDLLRMVYLTEDSAYLAKFLEEILGLYIDSIPKTLGNLYNSLGFAIPQKLAAVLPTDFFSDDAMTQESKSPLSVPLTSSAHRSASGGTESDQLEEIRTRSAKKRRKNAIRHKSIAEVSQNLRQIEIPKVSKRATKNIWHLLMIIFDFLKMLLEVTKVRRNLFNQEMISPSKRIKRGLPRSHSVSAVEGLEYKLDNFKSTKGYRKLLTKSVAETPVHKQISRRLLHRQIKGRSADPGPDINVVEESPEKGENGDSEYLTLLDEAERHGGDNFSSNTSPVEEGEGSGTLAADEKPSLCNLGIPPSSSSEPCSPWTPSYDLRCTADRRQRQAAAQLENLQASTWLSEASASPQTYEVELEMQASGLPKLRIKKIDPSPLSEAEPLQREESFLGEESSLPGLGMPRASKSSGKPEATYLSPPCLCPSHSTPGKSGGQTYICQSCTPTRCPSSTPSPFQTDVGVPWTPSPKHSGKTTPDTIKDWPRRKRAVDRSLGSSAGRSEVSTELPGAVSLLELEGKERGLELSITKTAILGDFELEGVCQLPDQSPPRDSVPKAEEAFFWGQSGLGSRKRLLSAKEEADCQAKRVCDKQRVDSEVSRSEERSPGTGVRQLPSVADDEVFVSGATPPPGCAMRSCLSASGLQALTHSPLLFQGKTPSQYKDARDEDVDVFPPTTEDSPFSRAFSRRRPISRTYTRKKLIS